jgi:hypothetical protein
MDELPGPAPIDALDTQTPTEKRMPMVVDHNELSDIGRMNDGGFILGARSMPGNPYDGHTLADRARARPSAQATAPRPQTAGCRYRSDGATRRAPEDIPRCAPTAHPSMSACSRSPPFSILNQTSNHMGIF